MLTLQKSKHVLLFVCLFRRCGEFPLGTKAEIVSSPTDTPKTAEYINTKNNVRTATKG